MSLDVSLIAPEKIEKECYCCGFSNFVEDIVYESNITHNLNTMASEAGIYQALWSPEEINALYAEDIIEILEEGLKDMTERPKHYKQFDSENGWGIYIHFIPFVRNYLNACKENPKARIVVDK